VFVRQTPGSENPKYPNRVYKLSKFLYGLNQAPRAWHARIKTFDPKYLVQVSLKFEEARRHSSKLYRILNLEISLIFYLKSISNLKKFLWRKLFLSSNPS
jgi:hypothetical protein